MPETETQTQEEEQQEGSVDAVSSRTFKRFLCQLQPPKGEDNVETVPYTLTVTAPRRATPKWVTPVPYTPAADAPPTPTCYLQIWEMDLFATQKWSGNEETDFHNENRNQLLAAIPGVMVRTGEGSEVGYTFRALGGPSPTRSEDPLNGSIQVELQDFEGELQTHVINLPEYESVLEIACVLTEKANDSRMDQVADCSAIAFVHNVRASARRQIEERGGISIALVSDYDLGDESTKEQRNNAELSRQAKAMIGTLPTFVVKDGKLRFGYHLVKGYTSAPSKLSEVRQAVAKELELGVAPKVTTLTLYAHGVRHKLQLNPDGYGESGSVQANKVDSFVSAFKEHLGRGLVVSLFACNNGRGARAGGKFWGGSTDPSYAHPLVGEIPGHDSLGWTLLTELERQGLEDVTVWSHTTAGHTTRNARLRVFSSWGVADFTSVLFGGRNVATKTYRHYASRFSYSFSKQKPDVAMKKVLNANKIRSISVQSARYLPWAWQHGESPDPKGEGFHPMAQQVTEAILAGIRGLMAVEDLEDEAWIYEDDATKLHITGRSSRGGKERLSAHFDLREFQRAEGGSPLRLGVRLVQALEILRVRTRTAIKVEALLEGGEGVRLRVHRNQREKVMSGARALQQEGLLTGAWEVAERIVISTSGLTYTGSEEDPLEWVTGTQGERYAGARVTHGIAWEAVSSGGRVHRKLCLIGQRLIAAGATLAGVSNAGDALRLDGGTPEAGEALEVKAREFLGAGQDGLVLDRLSRDAGIVTIGVTASAPDE
ncbi:MAG TPA: hypothetical protein DEA08_28635 [Planctomycetes bacterium]|nr:hypothetical protein [Planctomycetota bacterium]